MQLSSKTIIKCVIIYYTLYDMSIIDTFWNYLNKITRKILFRFFYVDYFHNKTIKELFNEYPIELNGRI